MIKIINVKWVDFKRIILLIDKSMESNSFLVDCGRFIDNLEFDVMDGNNHIFAYENVDVIGWNVDIDVLKIWRDMLDEMATDLILNKCKTSKYDFNVIQMICDDIESYITDNENGMGES